MKILLKGEITIPKNHMFAGDGFFDKNRPPDDEFDLVIEGPLSICGEGSFIFKGDVCIDKDAIITTDGF